MNTLVQRDTAELLDIEVVDAWLQYLEAVRGQDRVRYDEVEGWAWTRLAKRLKSVRDRRGKIAA